MAPSRAASVVLLEGDDQRKLGGKVPAGHQGGALHFGRDGKLYIAIGEQTAGQPAQRLDTFQGKLLRINPDGTIPEDNPFFTRRRGSTARSGRSGLRNPFTFAVQPGTGRIFINDVGAEHAGRRSTRASPAPTTAGPQPKGQRLDPRFRGPIHTYPVASIAGGAFCPEGRRLAGFPPRYRGKYFFMDFVQGWIKVLDPDQPADVETFATGLTRPVRPAVRPRRGPVRAAPRRLGDRRQVPAAHRLAAQDPPCLDSLPSAPRRSLIRFAGPFACACGLAR